MESSTTDRERPRLYLVRGGRYGEPSTMYSDRLAAYYELLAQCSRRGWKVFRASSLQRMGDKQGQ